MSQTDVFTKLGVPVLADVVAGHNVAVLCYGAPQSGRTHTMTGPPDDPGIIPRLCDGVFGR